MHLAAKQDPASRVLLLSNAHHAWGLANLHKGKIGIHSTCSRKLHSCARSSLVSLAALNLSSRLLSPSPSADRADTTPKPVAVWMSCLALPRPCRETMWLSRTCTPSFDSAEPTASDHAPSSITCSAVLVESACRSYAKRQAL